MTQFLRGRTRRKTLREKILYSKAQSLRLDEESLSDSRSTNSKSSFLASTPVSLKGSFLRNMRENPIFSKGGRSMRFVNRMKSKKSKLTKVQNASDLESDSEIESDPRIEINPESRWKLFRSGFFRSKVKKNIRRLSSDSNESSSSSNSNSDDDSEGEVDMLTKLEDVNVPQCDPSKSYVLYTNKRQAVRIQFFYDYLLISPVLSKLSLTRHKLKPKVVYYEDLALWTNNDECLRLVHIKHKNTARQCRSEIKLFISKKKVVISPQELNEVLKDKVSVLMAQKSGMDIVDARSLISKSATQFEVNRTLQEIDRDCQKLVAKGYQDEAFALANV